MILYYNDLFLFVILDQECCEEAKRRRSIIAHLLNAFQILLRKKTSVAAFQFLFLVQSVNTRGYWEQSKDNKYFNHCWDSFLFYFANYTHFLSYRWKFKVVFFWLFLLFFSFLAKFMNKCQVSTTFSLYYYANFWGFLHSFFCL